MTAPDPTRTLPDLQRELCYSRREIWEGVRPMSATIFDGNSRLELTRSGEPESGYRASSYRTRIAVVSGPFSASVEAFAQNWEHFLSQLNTLNGTMRGEASLGFWNDEHVIKAAGSSRGDLTFDVTITDSKTPRAAYLVVKLILDQSYLPQIIADLKREFS